MMLSKMISSRLPFVNVRKISFSGYCELKQDTSYSYTEQSISISGFTFSALAPSHSNGFQRTRVMEIAGPVKINICLCKFNSDWYAIGITSSDNRSILIPSMRPTRWSSIIVELDNWTLLNILPFSPKV